MKSSHKTDHLYLSHELKTIDKNIKWHQHRKKRLEEKLRIKLAQQRKASFVQKWIPAGMALGFVLFTYVFIVNLLNPSSSLLSSASLIEGVHFTYEMEKSKKVPVLTQEGRENSVYPLDASQSIKSLSGEPEIFLYLSNIEGKQTIYSQAFYSTTIAGQTISIHTTPHSETVDELVTSHLPHKKFPAESYTAEEVDIAGHRGVLQINNDRSLPRLTVITDKNVYYFYYTADNGHPDTLIELAKKFKFENDW